MNRRNPKDHELAHAPSSSQRGTAVQQAAPGDRGGIEARGERAPEGGQL